MEGLTSALRWACAETDTVVDDIIDMAAQASRDAERIAQLEAALRDAQVQRLPFHTLCRKMATPQMLIRLCSSSCGASTLPCGKGHRPCWGRYRKRGVGMSNVYPFLLRQATVSILCKVVSDTVACLRRMSS